MTANVKTDSVRFQKFSTWSEKHPFWIIGILICLGVGPWIDKAVHIDDPLFVWTAEQIQRHPANFYGFAVNWFGSGMPMTMATCNPPLTSYVLAAAMSLAGPGEIILHGVLLLVAFAAGTGIYQLAKNWCERPLLATAVAMTTPVFLVSSTTSMCDIPMLALWLWAVVLWEHALKTDGIFWYLIAGMLAGLAVLIKYSALTLLPLLPIVGLLRKRRPGWWMLWLAVPVAMIAADELITARIYGQGLISVASDYAAQYRFSATGGRLAKAVIGLVYTGGCLLPATLFALFLWSRQPLVIGAVLTGGVSFATILGLQKTGVLALPAASGSPWLLLQMTLMLAGGLHLLLLAGAELWRGRDTVTGVAALWLISGFIFAAVLNWTESARSLLPLVPPAAILIVRRLDRGHPSLPDPRPWVIPALLAGAFSLWVAAADTALANSARTAARQIAAENPPARGKLWFEGHGAFQFYLEKLGGQAVDYSNSSLQSSELLVIPDNNSNLINPAGENVELMAIKEYPVGPGLCTVRADLGAGFYGAGGCIPFVLGEIPSEKYYIYKIIRPFQFNPPTETLSPGGMAADSRLALAGYEAVLQANPNDAQTHANLADILCRLGKMPEAREHYRMAVRLLPDQAYYLNNLAWLLATCADDRVRNGPEAIPLAEHTCALTQYKKTIFIGTLAAAYAEAGRFDDAVVTAQKACANATAQGEVELLRRNQELLALYQQHQAYHESTGRPQ